MNHCAVAPAEPLADLHEVGPADLLALYGIHKTWGDRRVLESLDLVVETGTVVWIGGMNGAGKTTIMRIAAGLFRPDSGIVWLDGLHPERNRRQYLSRVGFLSAGDRGIYARLSPRRHLDFCARMALIPKPRRAHAVERAIARFALEEIADRRADRLSMGQRQRVRLAMTFVHEPQLVLLDEPANSLDSDGIAVLSHYLGEVTARGGAVLWVSPEGVESPVEFDEAYLLRDRRLVPA